MRGCTLWSITIFSCHLNWVPLPAWSVCLVLLVWGRVLCWVLRNLLILISSEVLVEVIVVQFLQCTLPLHLTVFALLAFVPLFILDEILDPDWIRGPHIHKFPKFFALFLSVSDLAQFLELFLTLFVVFHPQFPFFAFDVFFVERFSSRDKGTTRSWMNAAHTIAFITLLIWSKASSWQSLRLCLGDAWLC